jgi:hypothetical protein
VIHQLINNNPSPFPLSYVLLRNNNNNNNPVQLVPTQQTKPTISYLGNDWDEDGDPLAHGGGGGAFELLAADLAASGRWRTKGFVESLEAVEENSCLLFSWTFMFFMKQIKYF